MLYLRSCPKCRGDMEDIEDGKKCINCGYPEYTQEPLTEAIEKKYIMPKISGCEFFPIRKDPDDSKSDINCLLCPLDRCYEEMSREERGELRKALGFLDWDGHLEQLNSLLRTITELRQTNIRQREEIIELRKLKEA